MNVLVLLSLAAVARTCFLNEMCGRFPPGVWLWWIWAFCDRCELLLMWFSQNSPNLSYMDTLNPIGHVFSAVVKSCWSWRVVQCSLAR